MYRNKEYLSSLNEIDFEGIWRFSDWEDYLDNYWRNCNIENMVSPVGFEPATYW